MGIVLSVFAWKYIFIWGIQSLLVELIGIHSTLLLGAIGGLLSVIWVYFSPVRNLIQPPPAELEDEPGS